MSDLMQSHRERIGKRIRLARKAAGLSHDQLAAKVGSSCSHLIKLEKGMHAPGDALAKKIAEATGRTVEYLSGEGPDDEDEESDPVAALTFAIKRLVQAEVRAL
jgi:transcriptional regulator with XRE-family HTH domain